MRNNQPVTSQEYKLSADDYLISRTDLKGRITFANRAFIEASGFAAEELLGAAHNLVRHPDMPPEAFADLWQTIQSGRSWVGIVKNRRRNGDFYWVSATVTPTVVDGQLVGYTSVRAMAQRDQVEAASAAYARLREGNGHGLCVRDGAVVRRGLAGLPGRLCKTTLKGRILLSQTAGLFWFLAALLAFETVAGSSAAGPLRPWLWGGFALAVASSFFAGTLLLARVNRPVQDMLDFALRMGAGDLTTRLEYRAGDEVGALARAMRTMQRSLLSVVGEIQEGMSSISTATRQVAAGNSDLSQRTE
ncbi:PAS domain-containing protein, partial [Cupriavidus basilensis]